MKSANYFVVKSFAQKAYLFPRALNISVLNSHSSHKIQCRRARFPFYLLSYVIRVYAYQLSLVSLIVFLLSHLNHIRRKTNSIKWTKTANRPIASILLCVLPGILHGWNRHKRLPRRLLCQGTAYAHHGYLSVSIARLNELGVRLSKRKKNS